MIAAQLAKDQAQEAPNPSLASAQIWLLGDRPPAAPTGMLLSEMIEVHLGRGRAKWRADTLADYTMTLNLFKGMFKDANGLPVDPPINAIGREEVLD